MDASKHKKPDDRIKKELQTRSISQVQMALDLNLERSRVNLIANGWVVPGPAVRQTISGYLGIPETELFSTGGI